MRLALFFVLPLLVGCASVSDLNDAAPVAVYHSPHGRSAVADCLLDRLGSSGVRPERQDSVNTSVLRFTSMDQWTSPGLYLFTIEDEGTGSLIEARMPHGFVKRGLPIAQTCF